MRRLKMSDEITNEESQDFRNIEESVRISGFGDSGGEGNDDESNDSNHEEFAGQKPSA